MEQYPTKDLTIDPQVAEEAIKRLALRLWMKLVWTGCARYARSYVNTLTVKLMMKN